MGPADTHPPFHTLKVKGNSGGKGAEGEFARGQKKTKRSELEINKTQFSGPKKDE